MYKFSDLTFDDFEFKGEKLSEHDGYVGSASGALKTYSLLLGIVLLIISIYGRRKK